MALARLLVILLSMTGCIEPVLSASNAAADASRPEASSGAEAPVGGSSGTGAPRIEITLDAAASDQPYSGRVYVMTTRSERGRPIDGPDWFNTQPFYALDVSGWKPGEKLAFDAGKALGYPGRLDELPAGRYRVQAAIDLNGTSHRVVNGAGNGTSDVATLDHDPAKPSSLSLTINRKVPAAQLRDTATLKYVKLRSELLSRFFGREVFMQAAVGLPASYEEEPQRRFPAFYVIPGFGGDITHARWMARTDGFSAAGVEMVVVYLDPDCASGHHVFADSANNGPRGEALVKELIPHVESQFRLIAEAGARYVNGHSSGGWSSLWLQVTYPETFGGCWSTSPDPVDFTDFQRINIYDPSDNFFTERDGSRRPLARAEFGAPIWYKDFSDMEVVLGRGGQLYSFEAVFSPRGADGRPRPLWDRKTGAIDAAVAEAWRKYDIRNLVETQWATLGPRLAGKLHLFCGDADTFYLEGAFFKLRDALARLGSDAFVEVIPGAGHGLPQAVDVTIRRQVAERFARFQGR